jgi:predicted nuclease of predicted toxin-antitoxin system
MKIVIDMNLSPDWVAVLQAEGWEARHWSEIGNPRAADTVIMQWAQSNGYIVFTHDLDFSALLAASNASGPSVIQVRAQNTMPAAMGPTVIAGLRQFAYLLAQGALIVIDMRRSRARILPLRNRNNAESEG